MERPSLFKVNDFLLHLISWRELLEILDHGKGHLYLCFLWQRSKMDVVQILFSLGSQCQAGELKARAWPVACGPFLYFPPPMPQQWLCTQEPRAGFEPRGDLGVLKPLTCTRLVLHSFPGPSQEGGERGFPCSPQSWGTKIFKITLAVLIPSL